MTTDWRISYEDNRIHRVELGNGALMRYDQFPDDHLPIPDAAVSLTRPVLIRSLIGGGGPQANVCQR
ncbi:hypothetical protein [Nocardia salmonicida]|uniref:hypothetical protein n=1 Tax=Nocardia salmonicida TaxID=53431 RepID=UPI003629F642